MRRTICLLFVLIPVLLAGCSSNDDRRVGSFQAAVQGEATTHLEGSAQLFVETDDDGAPSYFEIMLFAENGPNSEIVFRNAAGSGAPDKAAYSVEQTPTGATPLIVRAEYTVDRFDTSAPRYVGETGVLEITHVTDATAQGQFNFDAVDGATGERVTVSGQFAAQAP